MKVIQLDSEYIFKHQVQIIEQDLPLIVENVKGSRRRMRKERLKAFLAHPGVLDKYNFYITEEYTRLWQRICTTKYNFPVDDNLGSIPNLDGSKLINEFKRISQTPLKDRIDHLTLNHNRLNDVLLRKKGRIDRETARNGISHFQIGDPHGRRGHV